MGQAAPGVQFWRFPGEEGLLLDFFDSRGGAWAVPSAWQRTREEMVPRPLREYLAQYDPGQAYIGPEPFAREARLIEVDRDGEPFFTLAYGEPSLICYTRGRLTEYGLEYSNMWTYWAYHAGGRGVRNPPEFKRWGDAVFRWVRKVTLPGPEVRSHRRTPRVAEALAAGEIRLV
jgi:hypothetical protein